MILMKSSTIKKLKSSCRKVTKKELYMNRKRIKIISASHLKSMIIFSKITVMTVKS